MKTRIMIAITILITLTLFVGFAWACPGCGYHSGQDWGWGSSYHGNQSPQYQDFQNETAPLREELAARQGEYNALMAQDNPDPQRAGQLQQEVSRLQDQIHAKAQSYNMPCSYRTCNHGGNWSSYNNHGGWCW